MQSYRRPRARIATSQVATGAAGLRELAVTREGQCKVIVGRAPAARQARLRHGLWGCAHSWSRVKDNTKLL